MPWRCTPAALPTGQAGPLRAGLPEPRNKSGTGALCGGAPKKKARHTKMTGLDVELEGFEPSSRQGNRKPTTCLVFRWVSPLKPVKDNLLQWPVAKFSSEARDNAPD
jgi:hypothetical protein